MNNTDLVEDGSPGKLADIVVATGEIAREPSLTASNFTCYDTLRWRRRIWSSLPNILTCDTTRSRILLGHAVSDARSEWSVWRMNNLREIPRLRRFTSGDLWAGRRLDCRIRQITLLLSLSVFHRAQNETQYTANAAAMCLRGLASDVAGRRHWRAVPFSLQITRTTPWLV